MRQALVNNRHLGRILVRRFGADKASAFFERSGAFREGSSQLDAIRGSIRQAASEQAHEGGSPLGMVNALEWFVAEMSEEDAGVDRLRLPPSAGDDDEHNYGKKGQDLRKPLGDVYEALAGLVLLELSGDVDVTWQLLRRDFFPVASIEEDNRRLAHALIEVRKASAEREQIRRAPPRHVATAATAAPDVEAPMQVEASVAAAVMPPSAPPPPSLVIAPPAASVPALPAAGGDRDALAVLEQAADASPPFINKVFEQLDKASLPRPPSDASPINEEVVEQTANGRQLFDFVVRHKRSFDVLGEAHGHAAKMAAKKVAYMHAYNNPRLAQVISHEGQGMSRAPPPPQPVVPPAGRPEAISELYIRTQRLGYAPDYLVFNVVAVHEQLFECSFSTRDGLVLGTSQGLGKAAAKATAAERALAYLDLHRLPPSLPIPMLPSAAGSQHVASPATGISVAQQAICELLGEDHNPSFQLKLARLMTKSGQDDAALVELAQRMVQLSASQGGHTAGRRFKDEIEAMLEAAEPGDSLSAPNP